MISNDKVEFDLKKIEPEVKENRTKWEVSEPDYKNILKEQLDIIKSYPLEAIREQNTKLINEYKNLLKEDILKNKEDGIRRENEVESDLREKYPESKGYKIEKEVYLRDKDGNIVVDPITGEKRRIDFVVTKDGKVVDSVEVTSKTANKDDQMAKEKRIREAGGNYIKDSEGNLVKIPDNVHTRIERRD